MKEKIKICFVCHGNICRSPMAEFVFKKLAMDSGASDKFEVCSRATSSEEIYRGVGNPIYPPAKMEMKRRGVPFDENKRAQRLERADYDDYDLFVCMDERNVRNANLILPKGDKTKLLLDYTGRGGSVADPWYTDRFDIAYDDIFNGSVALLKALLK
ncbi:MAG: low molecular weight phosphotyrosine protein phosphatase [Clostridia bacterium]|nr:low molecular weight phosphotyrosine protein phosphatase [Clostridia bacterium]